MWGGIPKSSLGECAARIGRLGPPPSGRDDTEELLLPRSRRPAARRLHQPQGRSATPSSTLLTAKPVDESACRALPLGAAPRTLPAGAEAETPVGLRATSDRARCMRWGCPCPACVARWASWTVQACAWGLHLQLHLFPVPLGLACAVTSLSRWPMPTSLLLLAPSGCRAGLSLG